MPRRLHELERDAMHALGDGVAGVVDTDRPGMRELHRIGHDEARHVRIGVAERHPEVAGPEDETRDRQFVRGDAETGRYRHVGKRDGIRSVEPRDAALERNRARVVRERAGEVHDARIARLDDRPRAGDRSANPGRRRVLNLQPHARIAVLLCVGRRVVVRVEDGYAACSRRLEVVGNLPKRSVDRDRVGRRRGGDGAERGVRIDAETSAARRAELPRESGVVPFQTHVLGLGRHEVRHGQHQPDLRARPRDRRLHDDAALVRLDGLETEILAALHRDVSGKVEVGVVRGVLDVAAVGDQVGDGDRGAALALEPDVGTRSGKRQGIAAEGVVRGRIVRRAEHGRGDVVVARARRLGRRHGSVRVQHPFPDRVERRRPWRVLPAHLVRLAMRRRARRHGGYGKRPPASTTCSACFLLFHRPVPLSLTGE